MSKSSHQTMNDSGVEPDTDARQDSRTPETRARHRELTDQAGERHDALTTAIERLERALAEAGIHRERRWSERAAAALEEVRAMIQSHTDGVEEQKGLFDEIESLAPHLSKRVTALRKEHRALASRSVALSDKLGLRDDLDIAKLRGHAATLLADLRAHRAAEADLIYEAFWMEMGAPD